MEEALRLQIEEWKADPVLFVRMVFGVEPTEQQAAILRDIAAPGARVAVKAGHGVGKTTIAAWIAIWHVFLFPNSKVGATAPSASQLRDVLMAEIQKWLTEAHPWVRKQLKWSSMRLEVIGNEAGQFLTARTARPESPDALQGLHADNILFLLEEAFGIADKIFEVAKGTMTGANSRSLLIGNPTAVTGYGYDAFHRNKQFWKRHTLSCINSPLVTKEYVEECRQEYGEDSDRFKVRVLGEFPSQTINQLISRSLADEAAKRQLNPGSYQFAPVIIGVDCAWEGDDRTTVVMRQGLHSRILGSWQKMSDHMTLGGLINQWWDEFKADACFIDFGMGTGVYSFLKSIGKNPILVNFGGTSGMPEYANKRTEMWCEMEKWLKVGGQVEDKEEMIDDLVGPQLYFLPSGKKIMERKKEMKKRGIRSPDKADGLCLTFAAPVTRLTDMQAAQARYGGENKVQTDYDVLEGILS